MSNLGKQHESTPITESDKSMSKKHKMHRSQVEDEKDPQKRKALSNKYNFSHAMEHLKELGKSIVSNATKSRMKG